MGSADHSPYTRTSPFMNSTARTYGSTTRISPLVRNTACTVHDRRALFLAPAGVFRRAQYLSSDDQARSVTRARPRGAGLAARAMQLGQDSVG